MKKWQSIAALLGLLAMVQPASSAELKIFGSRVTKVIVGELGAQFEKATGYTPVVVADVAQVMKRRVEAGEPFDLAVLVDFQIDDLIKQGKLVPDSRVVVATSGVGVAIRAGAPKPEMTADGIKKALLNAKSIAYSTGPSGVHIARLIEKWGIAEQVKGKIVPPRTGTPIGEVVARGEADIGFQQVSELLPVKGIDYLGPLPLDINEVTAFAAAVHKAASAPDAGRALLKFLTAPAAATTIRKTGMEPG